MKSLFALILLLPALALSQTEGEDDKSLLQDSWSHYRWEIGVNGGVNVTSVTGLSDTAGTVINRRGKLYGLTLVYHFNKWLALKTDFDFENKGWTVNDYDLSTGGSGSGVEDVTQYLDYFDIPTFLHIGFGRRLKFDLNFGPYFAFLTNSEAFYTDSLGMEIPVTDPQFTGYSDFDWGLTYGGGIDFALGKRVSIGFDLLYEQGMKDITADGLRNTSLDFDFGINILFGEVKKK